MIVDVMQMAVDVMQMIVDVIAGNNCIMVEQMMRQAPGWAR